ncbi:tetratricopeptide repeat protein [uncultured Photobacterium sp.]|uniref:tetratricopeptide repeat protein n=1 Tax=uncultured Photobacterium sp. TaxID=173973 RepID=UPI0026112013|nr:tetratricopeptide repeat protein [uncultured Photobacterium sp.]
MTLFSDKPQTNKPKKPRLRLTNTLTLVILTLTSLWALWLVAPSKDMLTKLIERSTSPEVSLAFLHEMYIREPENREIIQQIINNYQQLGELDDALELTANILTKEDGTKDWAAFDVYLSLLLEKAYQEKTDSKTSANRELRHLIKSIQYIPEADLARKYADAAISLSMTEKGFELLIPHLHSGETSYNELIKLALQSSDYENSLKLQFDAFREFENLDEAQKLLNLFVTSDSPQLSKQFINAYKGKISLDPDYLKLTIDHSKLIGNPNVALRQSQKLLDIEPTDKLRASTAELALNNGNIHMAVSLLNQIVQNSDSPSAITRLHDLYRWQGDIENALTLSHKLLAYHPTDHQLRAGIEESRALGDIYFESVFFERLVNRNQIKRSEYTNWLNALEKAQGTDRALSSVKRLAAMRPQETELINHQARLYEYKGNYNEVIKQWQQLTRLREPTTSEALRFSDAYIRTFQPKLALAALTTPSKWRDADEDYLEAVLSLAWETSNREIAKQAQHQLMETNSDNIDLYRYLRINAPLSRKNIDDLITLYHRQGNQDAFLAALRATEKQDDSSLFYELLHLASSDNKLSNITDILLYRAQEAIANHKPDKALALYQQALKQSPQNASVINGILWLTINTDNHQETAKTYNHYKTELRGNESLWLVFATAAQQLGRNQEAEAWYQQLLLNNRQTDVAVILNYASLLDIQSQYDKAFKLRRYAANQLVDELLKLKDGDISYRSLVNIFAGEQFAERLAAQAALEAPSHSRTEEFFQYFLANNQADNVLFWHRRTALKTYKLPGWQQLSIAIQQQDRATMEELLVNSLNLPVADKNRALQLIGQHQKAWQHGQNNLGNQADQIAENQLLKIHVNQHPNKNHSIRSQVNHNSQWDITRFSLDYYSPHKHGNWRLGTDFQSAGTPEQLQGNDITSETRLRGQYQYQQLDASWKVGFDVAEGLGDQRLGLTASYEAPVDNYWNAAVNLGINSHIEASQLMAIAGQTNKLGLSLGYQPTARESIALQLNWHDLSTRFNDEIGQGWDFNIRVAEQFFFADPAWQIYGSLSMQKVDLSDKPLNSVNTWHQGQTKLTSRDFIEDEYQRLALGQRVWHGEPGIPGATVPSPRYWIDSSLGYNVTNSQLDMTLSSGLGWRVVGNDELFLSVDWQSQDRNGDQSLKLSMGYYYSF